MANTDMDKDEVIRFFDRQLKLHVLHVFDRENEEGRELERDFAVVALDMLRSQPAMAELAGVRFEIGGTDTEPLVYAPPQASIQ